MALAALRIAVGGLFLIFGQYKVFGTQFTRGGGFQLWIDRFLEQGAYPFMVPVLKNLVLPTTSASRRPELSTRNEELERRSETGTADERSGSLGLHSSSFAGAFKPGTSIFGCARRIAAQSGRCDVSIMTTENSGPLFSCSRTYNPRILKAMSRPFWRALQFAVLRLSICSRRSLPLPTGSVKNLVSSDRLLMTIL